MILTRRSSPKIGIIGLGAMGGAIASALMRAGHSVSGFDVDARAVERFRAAGGAPRPAAAEVAAESDLVLFLLRSEIQIEALLNGPPAFVSCLSKGAVAWVASTVSPDYVVALGKRLAPKRIHLLDGPVSGGVARAREGKLTLILAGDDEAIASATAVAPALAEHVFRVASTPGPASLVKAINQLLTASQIALTAEALAIATRAGVDPETLQRVVGASTGASRMFADRVPRMVADDVAPHATLGIFLKDLKIALDAARRLGVATPVADSAREVFAEAAGLFGEDIGDPAIFRLRRPGALPRRRNGAVQ